MEPKCAKCKSPMKKMRTINSGNSKFDCFTCPVCGNEKQQCIAVAMT